MWLLQSFFTAVLRCGAHFIVSPHDAPPGRTAVCGGTRLKFTSFAVGGGTPLILDEGQLEELFCLAELFGVHPSRVFTSVETSPEYTQKSVLRQLRARGVERLSMGVQSFNETELKKLKRRPGLGTVVGALENIVEAGFPQFNLDLIYGIEGQTVESFMRSLNTALTYRPNELFIYPLYVRPGTRIDVRSTDDIGYAIYKSARELTGRARICTNVHAPFCQARNNGNGIFVW